MQVLRPAWELIELAAAWTVTGHLLNAGAEHIRDLATLTVRMERQLSIISPEIQEAHISSKAGRWLLFTIRVQASGSEIIDQTLRAIPYIKRLSLPPGRMAVTTQRL